VLSSHPALRQSVLHSTLSEFPIIGNDLASNIKALHRNSVAGLVIGIVGLVWGSLGLAQNGIFTMSRSGTSRAGRPSYLKRLGRSVSFLAVLAVGLLVSTFLAAGAPTARGRSSWPWGRRALAVVNFGEYLFAFRVLTRLGSVASTGARAVLAGIGWTILQSLGGFVVGIT